MSRLQIINKSSDHPRFHACLSGAGPEDKLLLIESAVTALADRDILWPESVMVYALQADIESRGLGDEPFFVPATPIDFETFVTLTLEADKVVSW